MTYVKRLEKLEKDLQRRTNELFIAGHLISEICTGLTRCQKRLDAATYARVETVLRAHAEEVAPWLVSNPV